MNHDFLPNVAKYTVSSYRYYLDQKFGASDKQLKQSYSKLTKAYRAVKANDTGKYSTKPYDQEFKIARALHKLDGKHSKSQRAKKLTEYEKTDKKILDSIDDLFMSQNHN